MSRKRKKKIEQIVGVDRGSWKTIAAANEKSKCLLVNGRPLYTQQKALAHAIRQFPTAYPLPPKRQTS